MPKKTDVICMGDLVADITFTGHSANGYPIYEQNPGGGSANVAVSVARLGGQAAFLGKMGTDNISRTLMESLEKEHVDLSSVICTESDKVVLAFIHTSQEGERSFSFYGDSPVDLKLKPEELNTSAISQARILSYGGRVLSTPDILRTTQVAVEAARSANTRIAFDPNIRLSLWPDEDTARNTILNHIPTCDYLKLSTEEVLFLFGNTPTAQIVEQILGSGVSLIAITDGSKGAAVYTREWQISQPGYPVNAIDTTGAGDSFWGSLLYQLSGNETKIPSRNHAQQYLAFSCACGALATTRQGAVPAMPREQDVKKLLSTNITS